MSAHAVPPRAGGTTSRLLALAILCAGQLMVILDGTIVNVALPAMQESLGLSASGLGWVVNAYLIPFGGFLLLAGLLRRPLRPQARLRHRSRPVHRGLAAVLAWHRTRRCCWGRVSSRAWAAR
ncbi:hypothetical protein SFUMM280S_02810 [Streptomyces fumanus]